MKNLDKVLNSYANAADGHNPPVDATLRGAIAELKKLIWPHTFSGEELRILVIIGNAPPEDPLFDKINNIEAAQEELRALLKQLEDDLEDQ